MKRVIHKYRYFFYPVFIIAILIFFGYVITWLWNWLIPEIFGLTTINFWQALGLFILSRILFSGMGGKGGKHSHHGGHKGREKWKSMTPEERKEWFSKRKFAQWMDHNGDCFSESDSTEKDASDSE